MEKMLFEGVVTSIQPRIRVLRSFDRDSPSYLGYALTLLDATSGRTYSIGIGVGSQQKHQFRVGMTISGSCIAVLEPHLESVDYYRASKLKRLSESPEDRTSPPWRIAPPPISVYRSLSPRRLSEKAYEKACLSCIWGCRMAVEIITEEGPEEQRYRMETFCYGPATCKLYVKGIDMLDE